jgi:O-antigen/teichoic acid export membrane protein
MRRAFLGGACISLQPLVLSALMLPVTAYVIRGLGPTAYGQWATGTAIVAAISFVTNLGLRGTYVRSIARTPELAEAAFADQVGARTGLSLLAAALAVALSLALRYPHVVVVCTAISAAGLLLLTVSTTAADTLQALHRLPVVAGVNMAAGLCLTFASMLAIWLGSGPISVAASYLVGTAVSSVLLLWIIRRQHFRPRVHWDLRRCASLVFKARFIGAQQLVFAAAHHAEALLIPALVGPTLFGFFSAGALLASRLGAVPEGLCSAAYPAMVSAHRDGTRAVLSVFARFLGLVLLTCTPGALAVSLLAAPIAHLLFPGRSEVSEHVMRITIWLVPAMGVHFAIGYLLNALDMDAEQARASLVASVVSIALTCVLVWNYGIFGACWSMLLRYFIHLATQAPYVIRILKSALSEDGSLPRPGIPEGVMVP